MKFATQISPLLIALLWFCIFIVIVVLYPYLYLSFLFVGLYVTRQIVSSIRPGFCGPSLLLNTETQLVCLCLPILWNAPVCLCHCLYISQADRDERVWVCKMSRGSVYQSLINLCKPFFFPLFNSIPSPLIHLTALFLCF